MVLGPQISVYLKMIFLMSQAKHMLWVLERTVSMRLLSTQNTCFNWLVRKLLQFLARNVAYLDLWFFYADLSLFLAPKPDFYHVIHDGPVTTTQRSPFFKEILLCVGGWSFTIWKEGITVSA